MDHKISHTRAPSHAQHNTKKNTLSHMQMAGSLDYVAPEVVQSVRDQGSYNGYLADLWSCGVVL